MEHRGFTPPRTAGEAGVCTAQTSMSLSITSTTGSPVELIVPRGETLESLRTRISHKLRLQTDRMVLVHKDRHLTAGRLMEQGVRDGSKLTLVPMIETGFTCSNSRKTTVMDMLESLTDTQINDFLSGRSPLALSVGTGAHTMYVQLQLSQNVTKLQEDEDSKTSDHHPSSSTSQTSCPSLLSHHSSSSPHCTTQRPRGSFKSSAGVSPVSRHSSASLLHSHSDHVPPSLSGFPRSSCLQQAATPVGSDKPSSSIPEPLSPAAASTFTQPGAVIESFSSHSPGVFSGTFSGTLTPCSQSDVGHPRRGVSVILQILNDLLKAAYHHKGAPTPLHHCPTSSPAVSQPSADEPCKARNIQLTRRAELKGDELLPSSLEENKALQCKLERLHFLMHRRRLRRRTQRSPQFHQATHPKPHQRHRSSVVNEKRFSRRASYQ
uniref:Ubiquitin-like domain-containing protein n=1 Tax=Iconisemion striatum TaxID=60296 RepID=A0A1A7YIH0_9TELE